MKNKNLILSLSLGLAALSDPAFARITSVNIVGEIEEISLTGDPNDIFSPGRIKVDGQSVILPRNLLIDLPANRLTLQQIYADAPAACKIVSQTGLAQNDTLGCNTLHGDGAIASIKANRQENGQVIAGEVFIEKAQKSLTGVITYIDYNDGYFRLNGDYSFNSGGTVVRINDPIGRHTIQKGFGCLDGPNCSPDPRFGVDPDNYTFDFSTGYPACIPSTELGDPVFSQRRSGSDLQGRGDAYCPDTNRNTPQNIVNNSYYFSPIILGDHVVVSGNYEHIDGVKFFSSYDVQINTALLTNPGQPDYMTFAEVDVDVAGFEQNRAKALFIGFTTLPNSQVDVFSLHFNPFTGEQNRKIIGTTVGNPETINQGGAVNGFGIFKIHYDIDFLVGSGRLGPCLNLANGGFNSQNGGCLGGASAPISQDLSIITPSFRELIGVTRNKIGNPNQGLPPIGSSFDILGNEAQNGQYLTPVGAGFAEWEEIDLNLMWSPFLFEGIPWLLDRRLGPGGCEEVEGSQIPCSVAASATNLMRLDPFPYSGLDPRDQATALPTRETILRYFPFTARNQLSYPPSFGIAEVPGSPTAVEDLYSMFNDSSITVSPLQNDSDTLGLNPASLEIVIGPTNGQANINVDGTISYTPNQNFVGTDVITYRVANIAGVYSVNQQIRIEVRQRVLANLTITRAQVRVGRLELEVRGTHAVVPNGTVSLYNQNGVLIASNIPVDPLLGTWIFRRQIDPAILPLLSVVARSNWDGVATAVVTQRR